MTAVPPSSSPASSLSASPSSTPSSAPRPSTRPVAVVTGASRGIGAAIAVQLAQAGHDVALLARSVPDLERTAAAVRDAGGQALVLPTDATDAAAVAMAIAEVQRTFGRLDVVVANVGVYRRAPATSVTRADLELALRDNFWSAFHTIEAALPVLRAQRRGHVVILNSFDAKKGLPQDAAYAAAKAALASFGASLRQALRPDGVHVCSVFPGRVDTTMVDHLEVPAISAKIPAERVARAVLRGIRRRRAEVLVPWHVRSLWWLDVLSPRLGDWLVRVLRLDGRDKAPRA